ncbi:MAG: hypothetical protein AAF478_13880, partial [Pseudomonadota bacterium]
SWLEHITHNDGVPSSNLGVATISLILKPVTTGSTIEKGEISAVHRDSEKYVYRVDAHRRKLVLVFFDIAFSLLSATFYPPLK